MPLFVPSLSPLLEDGCYIGLIFIVDLVVLVTLSLVLMHQMCILECI